MTGLDLAGFVDLAKCIQLSLPLSEFSSVIFQSN